MRQHDKSENGSAMSKTAAEHRRVKAPPPASPMLRQRRGCSTQRRAIAARPPFRPPGLDISRRQGYYADPGRWVGATVAERPVGWDVRGGDELAIFKGYGTERGAVSQGPASATLWLLVVSGGAMGPATSRGGQRVVAGDGTNSLLTVGPTSGVGGNAPVYRWRCAAQPRRGRSVQPSQRAGLEEDWWTWEPAQ